MFVDLAWRLNASRRLSASAELLVHITCVVPICKIIQEAICHILGSAAIFRFYCPLPVSRHAACSAQLVLPTAVESSFESRRSGCDISQWLGALQSSIGLSHAPPNFAISGDLLCETRQNLLWSAAVAEKAIDWSILLSILPTLTGEEDASAGRSRVLIA